MGSIAVRGPSDEILRQSQAVFRHRSQGWTPWARATPERSGPVHGDHVFASIQSLRAIDAINPREWDVVMVDEFHHSEAPTYRRLLERFLP